MMISTFLMLVIVEHFIICFSAGNRKVLAVIGVNALWNSFTLIFTFDKHSVYF